LIQVRPRDVRFEMPVKNLRSHNREFVRGETSCSKDYCGTSYKYFQLLNLGMGFGGSSHFGSKGLFFFARFRLFIPVLKLKKIAYTISFMIFLNSFSSRFAIECSF
jgi:hypothetical protein